MNPEELKILQIIKDIANSNKQRHAQLSLVAVGMRKEGISTHKKVMDRIFSNLKNSGMIKEDPNLSQAFIPTDFESVGIDKVEKAEISEIDIFNSMKAFYMKNGIYPTPIEAYGEYSKVFSGINPESFTRKIRKLFEEGKLMRTPDNRYYFNGINDYSKNLKRFASI